MLRQAQHDKDFLNQWAVTYDIINIKSIFSFRHRWYFSVFLFLYSALKPFLSSDRPFYQVTCLAPGITGMQSLPYGNIGRFLVCCGFLKPYFLISDRFAGKIFIYPQRFRKYGFGMDFLISHTFKRLHRADSNASIRCIHTQTWISAQRHYKKRAWHFP